MVRDPPKSPSVLQMGNSLWAEEHLPQITQSWDGNTCDSLRCQLLTCMAHWEWTSTGRAVTKGSGWWVECEGPKGYWHCGGRNMEGHGVLSQQPSVRGAALEAC